jgi:hypothetical protein
MAFDTAAVLDLFDKVSSHASRLGLFESVNTHEPKNAPGNGLWCSIWVQDISPVPSSGLASVSGRVELRVRIGSSMVAEPQDSIDPAILSAVTVLIGEYTGNFTLGATVRAIDLIGMEGTPLKAQAGYVQIGQAVYRVMEITLPALVNDMWTEVALWRSRPDSVTSSSSTARTCPGTRRRWAASTAARRPST